MPIGHARTVRCTAADVKPRRPGIMTTLVSSAFFREQQNNPAKIDIAIKALELARQQKIALLVLPAGFLTVDTRAEVMPAARPIIRHAKKYGMSLVVGVDLEEIKLFRNSDSVRMLERVALGQMPTFLCVFDAVTGKTQSHRQRSCTSNQARQRIVPDEVMAPKTMDISGSTVQIVFCGEIYDDRLCSVTAPSTAVIIGHTTMPRLIKTLKAKGRRGFSVIHSEHRAGRGGTLFCIDREADRSQQATLHIEGEKGLWLEAAFWKVTDKGRIYPAQPE